VGTRALFLKRREWRSPWTAPVLWRFRQERSDGAGRAAGSDPHAKPHHGSASRHKAAGDCRSPKGRLHHAVERAHVVELQVAALHGEEDHLRLGLRVRVVAEEDLAVAMPIRPRLRNCAENQQRDALGRPI